MPKDNHPPAFQLYVDDFISDSAVDAMTNEEVGIYVRFLCKAWKEEPVGTIPDDDKILANWAKTTPAAWKRCKAGVLRAFSLGDGRWHQKRMKAEWQKLLEYRDSRSRAGSKGAGRRWQSDGKAIAEPMANGMANDSSSFSPSSSISNSPSLSLAASAERERLVEIVAKRGVHDADRAVDAAIGRGCSSIQIAEAARVTDGKALLMLLKHLKPPSEETKAKKSADAAREAHDKAASDAATARLEREHGALYDAMTDAKVESLLSGKEYYLKIFQAQGKGSTLVRDWVLKHLDEASNADREPVVQFVPTGTA